MCAAVIDVVGIGNAIVDVIAHADERFLAREGLDKGAMTLIDAERAEALYRKMGPAIESSGGSAGNTMAGIASLGGTGGYIGKVRDDLLGDGVSPRHDLDRDALRYRGRDRRSRAPRAASSWSRRTGSARWAPISAPASISAPRISTRALIGAAKVTYLEGYLFDPPRAQQAFRAAAAIAHGAGHRVALSLSDPFCVGRHRAAFRELVMGEVDILFANEVEICSLYETDDFAQAAAAVRGHVAIAALTRSAHGSVILADSAAHTIQAAPVEHVVDTTGAGDLYAAGFLYGLTRGLPLPTCGAVGSLCAAEIISHVGARPEVALHEIVAAAGVI